MNIMIAVCGLYKTKKNKYIWIWKEERVIIEILYYALHFFFFFWTFGYCTNLCLVCAIYLLVWHYCPLYNTFDFYACATSGFIFPAIIFRILKRYIINNTVRVQLVAFLLRIINMGVPVIFGGGKRYDIEQWYSMCYKELLYNKFRNINQFSAREFFEITNR